MNNQTLQPTNPQNRPAGPAVRPGNSQTPYPRLCAHRGINTIAPENTMPALAAAVALGAEEIEFDLWASKDGELIVTHDPTMERTSDGCGQIWDLTYEEISKLDTGSYFSPHLRGLRFLRFEEVLNQFAHQIIMNIHIKSPVSGIGKPYDEAVFRKIVDLIEKYDCADYCYIAGDADVLQTSLKIAPHLTRACLAGQTDYTLVDNAIKYQCQILQLFKPYFNQEMIDKAHAHGIRCNVFWSDEVEEAKRFLDMGIDTILTNDYLALKTDLSDQLDHH